MTKKGDLCQLRVKDAHGGQSLFLGNAMPQVIEPRLAKSVSGAARTAVAP